MSPTVRPRAGLADATPDQLAAWRRRLELEEEVRAAAATLVESRMPAAPAGDDRATLVRAGLLVAAAGTVVAAYVALPLALAARALLGALPQALVLAAAVVVLGTVAVMGVLRRTAVELRPAGRRFPAHTVPVGQHASPGPGRYSPHAPVGHAPPAGTGPERPGGRHHAAARGGRRARHGGRR